MAEKKHYEQRLEENKCNSKGSLSVLKDIIDKRTSVRSCSRFLINNKITSDKQAVANGFNSFFINTGANLARSIPLRSPLTHNVHKTKPTKHGNYAYCTNDVINTIRNLKASSPGWDSISAVVVKAICPYFIEPLTHILNLFVMYGIFPSELKLAKVIPLFKVNDPMLFSNYRSVSVLPVFSKIFERIMYKQLLSFINEHKLLYSYQFGFRINHAPDLALLCLADKISDVLENEEYVLGLFLDFSKAFDTVNHGILFAKLEFLGIRCVCLQWFRSYLSKMVKICCMEWHIIFKATDHVWRSTSIYIWSVVSFCYISMTWPMHQMLYLHSYLPMALICLFQEKNLGDLVVKMNGEIVKVVDWLRPHIVPQP